MKRDEISLDMSASASKAWTEEEVRAAPRHHLHEIDAF
jgi:hypothetical protein